jgi:prepilin-type N-terminal cleavage/methylation domain-containing protein
MKNHRQYVKNGFTLVEILIAMCIIAIISMISAPSFRDSHITNRLSSQSHSLMNAFSFARTEALRRNSFVSICATDNATNCNTNNFAKGIIIYSNPTMSGLQNEQQIIRYYEPWNIEDKGKITVANNSSFFTFNANAAIVSEGNVLICHPTYNSYTLYVNKIGSLNITYNSNDGGC